MEKPDGMALTWKPRLVNTPTPIMSATTIAVATMTETECPPARSRLGHAGLPVSDAVMSGPSASRRSGHGASSCPPIQARLTSPKETVNEGNFIPIVDIPITPLHYGIPKNRPSLPQSRHDFVLILRL